ncbi:hypothetical protein ACA910_004115 [Epithemia clementina (nom. ined.)]
MVDDEELLSTFLHRAIESLHGIEIDSSLSRPEIRSLLLDVQLSTLSSVVFDYNDKQLGAQKSSNSSEGNHRSRSDRPICVEDVHARLKTLTNYGGNTQASPQLLKLANDMNEAARLTFARLVLFSGLASSNVDCPPPTSSSDDSQTNDLQNSGQLQRKDILEFCGLCQSALRLPTVIKHLQTGAPMFRDQVQLKQTMDTSSWLPHERMRRIQSILFQCLGYEPGFAHAKLKRLVLLSHDEPQDQGAGASSYNDDDHDDIASDAQVLDAIKDMMSAIHVVITHANNYNNNLTTTTTTITTSNLSDIDEGGVTRVVGVEYSEKIIDPSTGQIIEEEPAPGGSAPKRESMTEHEPPEEEEEWNQQQEQQQQQQQQKQQNQVQVAAACLQNEIYQELLQMSDTERTRTLEEAETVTQQFLTEAASKPPMDRIEFLRSIDPSTQRLMIMRKLWTTTNE